MNLKKAIEVFNNIERRLISNTESCKYYYGGICSFIGATNHIHRNRDKIERSLYRFNVNSKGDASGVEVYHYSREISYQNTERILGFYLWREFVLESKEYRSW